MLYACVRVCVRARAMRRRFRHRELRHTPRVSYGGYVIFELLSRQQ